MRFSFLRFVQWIGVAIVLVALVGLNFNFESKAGKTVNAPVENSLSQSIRGSWFLDDGSGTNATDASGNGNTLAMTGSPSWATGQIGPYALDFSGSGQYLSVADPSSGVLDFGDGADFTISGWFNRDTFAADHTLVAKKNDQTTSAGYVVWIDNNGGTDYLSAEISDGTDTYSAIGATNLSSTGWHQFSIVWDDSTGLSIYLDGKLDGSTTSSTTSINSLANALAFRIGAESDAGVPFDGKIDNITLYGRALSANEVFSLYQTVVPIQPVDTGLVGHWTFDGNDVDWGNVSTEIKDVSGKGNDGDAVGPTTASAVRGKLGQALSFNGSGDDVNVPQSSSIDFGASQNFTVALWIRTTQAGAASSWPDILSKDDRIATRQGYSLVLHSENVDTRWSFEIYVNGTGYDVFGSTDIADGSWHHIVGIRQGSSLLAYEDGVFANSGTGSSGSVSKNIPLRFAEAPNDSAGITGQLDDVRIYNRALSATEVANLYNVGR